MSKENINYTRDILSGLSPLVLTTSDNEDDEEHQCVPCTSLLKYDPKDKELNSLLDNNRRWAAAVMKENPYIFSSIAQKQEPKLLWIGCSDSRVPANAILALPPGELFVHRNIANVVNHNDMNVLSVLQYSVEVLKVEHIIVCGHYNCGGVTAAYGNQQYGLIDNWLRSIKDVYRLHQDEMLQLKSDRERIRLLVDLNSVNSAKNICHSTIVQNAWKNGQQLTVHAWAYDIEDGLIKKLDWCVSDNKSLEEIYHH
ncbi:hypothetical protein PS15m_001424 [Mucor circinelloides]